MLRLVACYKTKCMRDKERWDWTMRNPDDDTQGLHIRQVGQGAGWHSIPDNQATAESSSSVFRSAVHIYWLVLFLSYRPLVKTALGSRGFVGPLSDVAAV